MKIIDVDFRLKRINFIYDYDKHETTHPLSDADRVRLSKIRSHMFAISQELSLIRKHQNVKNLVADIFIVIIKALFHESKI